MFKKKLHAILSSWVAGRLEKPAPLLEKLACVQQFYSDNRETLLIF